MKIFKVLFLISILISCKKDQEEENQPVIENRTSFEISGKVHFDNGKDAKDVKIYLNDTLKATTGEEGLFEIKEVNKGDHKLKMSYGDAEKFSVKEIDISVEDKDLNLEFLVLPVPVKIYDPAPEDVTTSSITIKWNQCKLQDFREYRVYIHDTPGLDESHGTLVGVITNSDDTTHTLTYVQYEGVPITANRLYYMRVYVMDEYGQVSGSNVMEIKTDLWDNESNFTSSYTLTLLYSKAEKPDLRGIEWDGTYLWKLYGKTGDTIYKLVKTHPDTGIALDTIIINEPYLYNGLAWDGTRLWVNGRDYIRSVDIENGTLGEIFQIKFGIEDLAYDGQNVLAVTYYHDVIGINPLNNTIIEYRTPFEKLYASSERGIAYKDNEVWISSNWHYEICILDRSGNHIGVADVDFLHGSYMTPFQQIELCFMGNTLIINKDGILRYYSVEKTQ